MESKLKCVFENPITDTTTAKTTSITTTTTTEVNTNNGKNKVVGDVMKATALKVVFYMFIISSALVITYYVIKHALLISF